MSKLFNQVAVTQPNYSKFDLSHDHKTSLQMGKIVPVWVQECLPGDKYNVNAEAMFRLMPMIAPIMHKVDVSFHTFYVPNRLLWKNWEKFITGGETAIGAGVVPAAPVLQFAGCEPSSLANYLGVPVQDDPDKGEFTVNALPFAAYQMIFNEWYRDENLQPIDENLFQLIDGPQNDLIQEQMLPIRNRAWEHDYFTSALPYAQKGDVVELPMEFQDITIQLRQNQEDRSYFRDATNLNPYPSVPIGTDADGRVVEGVTGSVPLLYDPNGSLYADGDDFFSTTTINDLRTAWALQQWLEKNMRAGSRYKESILAHYGVRSSDARLDRPEYVAGSKGSIAVSEVLQTSSTDNSSPQANMAGHGISVMGTGRQSYKCEEHGFMMTLVTVMPKTAYMQGLPRMFTKTDRTHYAFPDFAQLGEQEVFNREIYFDSSDLQNNQVFGYLPRYAEYRTQPARVSGQMATTLLHWHMARAFAARPHLNASFVQSDPTTRIFAVEDPGEDTIVAHVFLSIDATRPLPMYGVPAPLV